MSQVRSRPRPVRFPVAPAGPVAYAYACAECRGHVMIHQPDERDADRLLGTCTACPAWYLVDGPTGRMRRLSDHDTLDDA